jgi:hypothetical protein
MYFLMIRLSIKKKRKVKPVTEIGSVGCRGMKIAVVRHLYDINESAINFI